jgi:hypothetical protein
MSKRREPLEAFELGKCGPFEARISQAQCDKNRVRSAIVCNDCAGLVFDSVAFAFHGDNAEVVRRFSVLSKKIGGDPATDMATVLDLFMERKFHILKKDAPEIERKLKGLRG